MTTQTEEIARLLIELHMVYYSCLIRLPRCFWLFVKRVPPIDPEAVFVLDDNP